MRPVVSLEGALRDSLAFAEVARKADVPVERAKALLVELVGLPVDQFARFIVTAHRERTRAAQTVERKKERR